jgi:hypothetical protein
MLESPRETAQEIARSADGDVDAILASVLGLHHELHAAGLLDEAPEPAVPCVASLGTFVAPRLETYQDLQEHLLLDPIHDVERGAGWPATHTS